MVQRQWLVVVPLALLLGAGGRALAPSVARGTGGRIVDGKFASLEASLGYHLYAPTWLPYDGRVGTLGALQGAHRIMEDFTDKDDRALCILSQERRTPKRDEYHERVFVKRADARASINGKQGYFITGNSGERRLFWAEADMTLILSSTVLTDPELVQVAEKVK